MKNEDTIMKKNIGEETEQTDELEPNPEPTILDTKRAAHITYR